MRKIIFLLVFVFASGFVQAQKTFIKLFNLPDEPGFMYSFYDIGKKYIIAGTSGNSVFTALLNDSLKVISANTFFADSLVESANLVSTLTSNNELLILAAGYPDVNREQTVEMLFKINEKGKVLWSKQIYSKQYHRFSSKVLSTNSKGEILLEQSVDYNKFQLLKLTKNGDLIWNKTFEFSTSFYNELKGKLIIELDNEIYMGANLLCGECEGTDNPTIFKFSSSGKALGTKFLDYSPYNYTRSITLENMFVHKDSMYLFVTSNYDGISLIPVGKNTTEDTTFGYGKGTFC